MLYISFLPLVPVSVLTLVRPMLRNLPLLHLWAIAVTIPCPQHVLQVCEVQHVFVGLCLRCILCSKAFLATQSR
jgi:hypothetical protein